MLFLVQQLFLQGETLLHLPLLDAVLGVRRFFFYGKSRVLAHLLHDENENRDEHQRRERGLQHAAHQDPVRYAADLFDDHALTDQIGEKPVGALDRDIAQRFAGAVVCKGRDPAFPGLKVAFDLLIGIAVLVFRLRQRFQKVVLNRKTAENGIAQGNSVGGVDICEGGAALLRLHGNAGEHILHVDLHEADRQLFALKRDMIHRQGDDDRFIRLIQVFDRNIGTLQRAVIKSVFVDIGLSAERGIDQPVLVDEGKLLQGEQPLHFSLICLKMLHVAQVFLCHQLEGCPHIGNAAL